MALIKCQFYSEVLGLSTSMTVILPQQTKSQIGMQNNKHGDHHSVLYLLHGLSDDDSIWMRRTSIERYVAKYGLAVVMPQMDNSFYTDMKYGKKYWTFLTEELPSIVHSFFPISREREDNFVAGLSMGGYGALKWALSYPDKFVAAASLSGVTDIVQYIEKGRGSPNLKLVFGEQNIAGTANDLFGLLEQVEHSTTERPILFQSCGTEDSLYELNVKFAQACEKGNFDLTTDFGPGSHEWGYWDEKIQKVLEWFPIKE